MATFQNGIKVCTKKKFKSIIVSWIKKIWTFFQVQQFVDKINETRDLNM